MSYTKTNWQSGDVISAEKLNKIEDGITSAYTTATSAEAKADSLTEAFAEIGSVAGLEKITYADLVAKRNSNTLTPGSQYRITDYVCTTTQSESRAVSHPFDVIVIADSEGTLNENARACLHDGDNYYSAEGHEAYLEAWKLKYCIDNDTDRFGWADANNGKGIIYYMKDDRGNECPYDFKQIQFKRTIDDVDTWFYTFSFNNDESIEDFSIVKINVVINEENVVHMCNNNIIALLTYNPDENEEYYGSKQFLNNIVFKNTFGNASCCANTFGDGCCHNTFGNNCCHNTFGNDCCANTFGDDCGHNTFGNNCYANTFGDNFYYNTFRDECQSNTFGNDCQSNTFGDGCCSNTFGDHCYSNTFGYECFSNTFGDKYYFNTFGDECYSNTFGDNCYYNIFGKSCSDINANKNGACYNVLLPNGLSKLSDKDIRVYLNLDSTTVKYIGTNSNGVLMTWNPADLAGIN